MLKTGLVSVSFRKKKPEEIVDLAKQCGLDGIEWGGDVHVQPGDIETAQHIGQLTRDAGLEVLAYGSYFRPGEQRALEFTPVLASAKALGAPVIRVWAGAKWSWRADEAYVQQVVKDTQEICDMAAKEQIQISYEYHGWTLTDNRFSATEVHREIDRDNMRLYWQPNFCLSQEDNLLALKMVCPQMRDVHVFYWDCLGTRFPLENGINLWKEYVDVIRADGKTHSLMLEFVKDDNPEQLKQDARTLLTLINR